MKRYSRVLICFSLPGGAATGYSFSINNFSDVPQGVFTLNGASFIGDASIFLGSSEANGSASVFTSSSIPITSDATFVTRFTWAVPKGGQEITGLMPGFCFMFQTVNSNVLPQNVSETLNVPGTGDKSFCIRSVLLRADVQMMDYSNNFNRRTKIYQSVS